MSGVTGYWAYSSRDLAEAVFAAFTHSLAHRGPDGFGIEHFPEARLWLGHRRLAIIDLSERARQPMSYAEGRYWLTYNGEVYNYVGLREELRGPGHRFVSNSDSEVILAAYAQWGQECQFRFNGMWAFAIWDIAYYAGLWATVRWPTSLKEVDILFLIPVPWVAQVWYPLLVSALTLLAVSIAKTPSSTSAAD